MAIHEAMVAQHDLVYEVPPRNWEDGFPLGNGHFGGMVWQPEDPDRIVFGITKLDVWDYRHRHDDLARFDRYKALLKTDPERANHEVINEPAYDVPYPCPKLCGRLSIGIDESFLPIGASVFTQQQRLRLHEARVECAYEMSTKAVRLSSFVDAESNVLAVQVENTWVHDTFSQPHYQSITLDREIDETLGMPETGTRDGVLYIRYPFPDGFEFVIGVLISGAECEPPAALPDRVGTRVVMPEQKLGPVYTVYLTVVTSKDADDPLGAACENLKHAEARGFERMLDGHREWWRRFWDASGVELGDRFLEGLWYFSLYQLASTMRGDTAPGLFGLWNMTKSPAWHGDYHGDYNISMAHWYLFSANHLELGEPFFRTFHGLLPKAKQQTMDYYQIDGVKFPTATAPDSCVEMCHRIYRMMQVSSAYYAIPFWWGYTYGGDDEFLRDVAFPVIEESSKFYLALVERTDDGLVIGPSWAPEQGPLPAYNVNNDLSLIRPVWLAYVEACRVLERDTPWLPQVVECLAEYPEYPQVNGRFLDSATADEDVLMAHTGLFAMTYPGGDIDADHPLADVAARTIDTYYERAQRKSFVGRDSLSDVQAWTTQALGSARLRRADRVDHYLTEVGLSEYLKPNGMITILSAGTFHSLEEKRAAFDFGEEIRAQHAFAAQSCTRRGRDKQFQFLEGVSALICIINEMMLQSHNGVLRIFPSAPDRIADCAFVDLRAEGAFVVSARCRGGRTERVEIESLVGGTCEVRLFRYDSAKEARLSGPDGELSAERIAGDTWRFETERGGRYSLTVGEDDRPVALHPSGESAGVKHFIDRWGEPIYYGKPAPETGRSGE